MAHTKIHVQFTPTREKILAWFIGWLERKLFSLERIYRLKNAHDMAVVRYMKVPSRLFGVVAFAAILWATRGHLESSLDGEEW